MRLDELPWDKVNNKTWPRVAQITPNAIIWQHKSDGYMVAIYTYRAAYDSLGVITRTPRDNEHRCYGKHSELLEAFEAQSIVYFAIQQYAGQNDAA